MKLVIDIPDEYYELYKDTNNNVSMNDFAGLYLLEIIRNSKPLPKGHGRLIDADELEECKEIMNTISGESKYAVMMDDIRNMSTIIEAESENKE